MANYKRKRAKDRRAGCLSCKPWKGNGCKVRPVADLRATQDNIYDGIEEYYYDVEERLYMTE